MRVRNELMAWKGTESLFEEKVTLTRNASGGVLGECARFFKPLDQQFDCRWTH